MDANQEDNEVYLKSGGSDRKLPRPVSRDGLFLDWPTAMITLFGILAMMGMLGAFIYFVLSPVKNCSCNCPGISDNYTSPWWPEGREWRLPDNLVPEHYALQLVPDFYGGNSSDFLFSGTVMILMRCEVSTDEILLNAKDLSITTINVNSVTQAALIPTTEVNADDDVQLLRIRLQRPLEKDEKLILNLGFKGKMTDGGTGLVYAPYTEAGSTKYVVHTSMGATSARSIFPCFDEPGFKATYELSVRRKEGVQVLSNTPVASSSSVGAGWTEVRFEELSTAIPTYHLVLVMGDMAESDITFYPMKLYGTEDLTVSGTQAREVAGPVMAYYNEQMPVTYPLSDLNLVSLPSYGMGYQGHYGASLFGDNKLEYDAAVDGICRRQSVTMNVATAIGQVWFGNMMTQAWWNDLWIMQGMAIFYGYEAARQAEPDWDWDQMQTHSLLQTTLWKDGTGRLPPVYRPSITRPEQIESLFSCAINKKAALIFRMLRDVIGQHQYDAIMESFISEYMYSTVSTAEMLDFLEQETVNSGVNLGVSLKEVVSTWIYQMAYPVLTFTQTGRDVITVSQQLFKQNPDVPIQDQDYPSQYGYKWEVPYNYITSTQPNRIETAWLHKDDALLSLRLGSNDWIMGNVGAQGYFRVNYDDENWSKLGRQLVTDAKVISTVDRARLIDDVLTFSRSGLVSGTLSMEVTRYLAIQEDEWLPFWTLKAHLAFLDPVLQRQANYGDFRGYVRTICNNRYNALGWEGSDTDPIELQYQRQLLVWMACSHGLTQCVDEATRRFRAWSTDPLNVDGILPDYRKTVFCTGVADGSEAEWNLVKAAYDLSTDSELRSVLREALSCSQQPWILRRWLEMIGDVNSTVEMHDRYKAIQDIVQTAVGRDTVMEYDSVWKTLCPMAKREIIKSFAMVASTRNELSWAQKFMSENSLSDIVGCVTSRIEANIGWVTSNGQQVLEYAARNCLTQCV